MRIFICLFLVGVSFAQGVLIDHACADLDEIPKAWITAVQDSIQSHYAHTSHGSQLTHGMVFVERADAFYNCDVGNRTLPGNAGAYCVFDGQQTTGYVGPEKYWQTTSGLSLTRAVLDNNPALDTSMWSWCTQCNSYSRSQVQQYLDAMTQLEREYPDVTFIYLTGNAQGTGSSGYNRFQRNNQIRDYCAANNKVLFDFADLDCWWYNPSSSSWEQNTYDHQGTDVPSEHSQYSGNDYGHTTAESCTIKAKAWWWMMAVLAGWNSTGISTEDIDHGLDFNVSVNSPTTSPFSVSVLLSRQSFLSVKIYDISGRYTMEVASGNYLPGDRSFLVNGLNSGIYFITVNDGNTSLSRKVIVMD